MTVGNGWYVAAGLELAEGENIKFRLDGDWAVNLGGTWAVGTKIDLAPNGDNMVTTAGTFDIYLNPDLPAAWVLEAGSAAPAAPETWGIVGTINGWGGNGLDWGLTLDADGKYWVRKGVVLPDGEEIKFRFGHSWDVNLGGTFAVDTEIALNPGGSNMATVAGTYDIYLDVEGAKAFFMTDGQTPPAEEAEEGVLPTPAGKQWAFDWVEYGSMMGLETMSSCIDLGVSIENYFMAGIDYEAIFGEEAAGMWVAGIEAYFEAEAIDATSGNIWLLQPDGTGELVRVLPIEYSNLTETTCTFNCPDLMLTNVETTLMTEPVTVMSAGIAM